MNLTPREEHVVADIEGWLQLARIHYVRYMERRPFNGRFYQKPSTPGVSDLIGYIPKSRHERGPLPFYIEVKRAKGSVTSMEQMQFIEARQKDGCIAFFAHSREEVISHFRYMGVDVALGARPKP